MQPAETARSRADAQFSQPAKHGEKGSAGAMIAAESRAVNEKTSRLKALRMARDAAEAENAPVAAPKAKARKTAAPKKAAAPRKAKPAA